MANHNPIIAALDVPSAAAALKLAEQIAPAVGAFKIGKELFVSAGPDIVKRVRATGAKVFLDLKFHDIPNTVAKAVAAALRSLRAVQRQNEEFRLSLHHGAVILRPTPTGEDAPFGPEIIFAMQLDRLASSLKVPILITETAQAALGTEFPTRRLGIEEMQSYSGT